MVSGLDIEVYKIWSFRISPWRWRQRHLRTRGNWKFTPHWHLSSSKQTQ